MDYAFTVLDNYLKKLNLNTAIKQELLSCFHCNTFHKDTHFAVLGSTSDQLGFVVSGLFYMYTINEAGDLFAKEFLGEENFLLANFTPGTDALVGIQALTDSTVLIADYARILKIAEQNPSLQMLSKSRLEKEYLAICNRAESMAFLSAGNRYRLFLEQYRHLEEQIPDYLIASYLCITPTHLCRVKSSLFPL